MNVQRANTLGHHRLGFNVAAVRGDLHGIAMGDAELVRQLLADLHKLLRLRDGVKQRVLGPVVEVLGQTIGGAHVRELVFFTQRFKVALEDTRCRVRDHVRVQRVSAQRRLKRLVVFRERPFCHLINGKQTSHPFRLHDKRSDIAAWCGSAVVRNIHAAPFRAVPLQKLTLRIPRVALRVSGGTVIEDATVKRPRPRPAQRIAEARRVGVVAVGHLVAFRRPATSEDPTAA
ncbi:Uncharacterised protein [Enterobacter kobei]|nr:Uncharacterised protein [Enterobacter kobei]